MIDCSLGVLLSDHIPTFARDWRNNEKIRRWCRQVGLITPEAQADWLERVKKDRSIQMYGIVSEAEGDFVGVCGLTSISLVHRTAEFSLYVAPEFQKKGYAKRALVTLLNYGFNELGLNNIWGEVLAGNPAFKVFSKLGFKEEAFLREMYFKSGITYGAHRISMLRDEFNEKTPTERIE